MKKLITYKYRIPFVTPIQTSQTTITHREGLILEYMTSDFTHYAEAAPLPGFSRETLDDVQMELKRDHCDFLELLSGKDPDFSLYQYFVQQKTSPSLQFALDSLAYQVMTHQQDKPQNHLFNDKLQPVSVNGLISLDRADVLQQVDNLIKDGFHTIKVKVGVNFDREFRQLKTVRANFPDVTLRLDANRAWSLIDAIYNVFRMEELNIEYCEEPLQKATIRNYDLLKSYTNVPLALDETFIHHPNWSNFLPYITHIVAKPMFIGSIIYTLGLKELAKNVKIVLTTSLESSIGRKITSLLAASGAGSKDLAHGLHTGHYLAEDILDDEPLISEGKYYADSQTLWKNLKRNRLQKLATEINEYLWL